MLKFNVLELAYSIKVGHLAIWNIVGIFYYVFDIFAKHIYDASIFHLNI